MNKFENYVLYLIAGFMARFDAGQLYVEILFNFMFFKLVSQWNDAKTEFTVQFSRLPLVKTDEFVKVSYNPNDKRKISIVTTALKENNYYKHEIDSKIIWLFNMKYWTLRKLWVGLDYNA